MIRSKVGFRLDGVEQIAAPHETITVPPGVAHDWWNAGDEEACVKVEVRPAARFELLILNLFGFANDGKTNTKGMPNPLQLAILGKEFQDVIIFTRPPSLVQKAMFSVVVPIARLLGYQGSYEIYTSVAEKA